MNRHTAFIRVLLFALLLVAGLWFSLQSLFTGALSLLVHTPYQMFIAISGLVLIGTGFVAGMLVWASEQPQAETPHRRRHIQLRALFHH